MSQYLSFCTDELKEKNAYWTAKEICQQSDCWREARDIVNAETSLQDWLAPLLAQENLRIILTGAGTSAYIGDALAPYLTKSLGRVVEAISTTDIVASPDEWLLPKVPTLLISYGRSGNSPESVAAVEIADKAITHCNHLVLSCNPKGKLAQFASSAHNAYNIPMPLASLDQSFAMTSSFTSMYVATLCIFTPDNQQLKTAATISSIIVNEMHNDIKQLSTLKNTKQIFLGSGTLTGIAREASLKYLELTAGKIGCFYESSLGFRHGPKSNIDETSIIIVLDSNDNYIRCYDHDMLNEIKANDKAMKVISLSPLLPNTLKNLDQAWLGLPYIVYCQLLAFYKSIHLGLTPDNPCPTGEVNRVVQGVNIYPFV
jgi:tagatose-6-phosphate ketose/aldose isomerase